jgi:hypothetical protein
MNNRADATLSEETVIQDGGWHERYARVLLIEQSGGHALVLVDGNGDGAELELEYWQRDAGDSWQGGSSSGHSGLDWLPPADSWSAEGFVYALGRADPALSVRIEYGGAAYSRLANEFGIWGFVQEADSSRPDELPRVTDGTHR